MSKFGKNTSRSVIFGILLACVIIVGSAAAYSQFQKTKPESIAASAIQNSITATGLHIEGNLEVVKSETNQAAGKLSLTGNVNTQAQSAEVTAAIQSLSYGSTDLSVLKLTAEARHIEGKNYFKIDDATTPINQTFEGLKKNLGEELGAEVQPLQNDLLALQKQLTEQWVQATEGTGGEATCQGVNALTKTGLEKLIKDAAGAKALRVEHDYGMETNNGVSERHLAFQLDSSRLDGVQLRCLKQFAGVSELWIDRASNRVDRVKLPITTTDNKAQATLDVKISYTEAPTIAEPEASIGWNEYRDHARQSWSASKYHDLLAKQLQ